LVLTISNWAVIPRIVPNGDLFQEVLDDVLEALFSLLEVIVLKDKPRIRGYPGYGSKVCPELGSESPFSAPASVTCHM